jgi:hypothetical protein
MSNSSEFHALTLSNGYAKSLSNYQKRMPEKTPSNGMNLPFGSC